MHRLHTDGFALVPGVLAADECATLAAYAPLLDADTAGSRCLLSQPWCAAVVPRLRAHPSLAPVLSTLAAVQCTYFAKPPSRNWLVALHQDLSIPVAARVSHPELRGWSTKEGSLFVQPPTSLLECMVAVRVHLDECTADDGPLRVVPGSHRHGVLRLPVVANARRGEVTCTAKRGDALAMRPLLLHGSSKAHGTSLRRVLHFLFGPRDLPCGLTWRHTV